MDAFIGLGRMGGAIAARLIDQGQALTVHDADAAVTTAFGARHDARTAATVGQAASGADVCYLCLPDARVVESCLLGPDGVMSARKLPRIVVDCSSSSPSATARLAAELAQRGVAFVDAPVSGGVRSAAGGNLAAMVGGAPADVDSVGERLSVFADRWVRAGDVGVGHATKALNNLLSAASLWATAETVTALAALGHRPSDVVERINASSARSQNSEVKFPKFILPGTYDAGFSVDLMAKDVGIAVEEATRARVGLPVGSVVLGVWRLAARLLPPGSDFTRVATLVGFTPEPHVPATDPSPALVDDALAMLTATLARVTAEVLDVVSATDLDRAAVFGLIAAGSGSNTHVAALARSEHHVPAGGDDEADTAAWLVGRTTVPMTVTSAACGYTPRQKEHDNP